MTEQASGESLYRKEPKIYPRQVTGRFARLRVVAVWVLLGLFYLLPWIRIAGKQSVLFDLPARKFYILGMTFWPQDFVYLALLLITAGRRCFSSPHWPAASGAASPARKPSGPKCLSGSRVGSRATGRRA